jgi:hypothetical protein
MAPARSCHRAAAGEAESAPASEPDVSPRFVEAGREDGHGDGDGRNPGAEANATVGELLQGAGVHGPSHGCRMPTENSGSRRLWL